MKIGLYVGERRDVERSLTAIVAAERRSLHGVWLPGVRARVRELTDAAAGEVVLSPLAVGDGAASLVATLAAMQDLEAG